VARQARSKASQPAEPVQIEAQVVVPSAEDAVAAKSRPARSARAKRPPPKARAPSVPHVARSGAGASLSRAGAAPCASGPLTPPAWPLHWRVPFSQTFAAALQSGAESEDEDDGTAFDTAASMRDAEAFVPADFSSPSAVQSLMSGTVGDDEEPDRRGSKPPERQVLTAEALRGGKLTRSGPMLMVTRPLPRVLLLHTGGTLGMDPTASFEAYDGDDIHLRQGTGGVYPTAKQLQPGRMLADLLATVPELRAFANLDVHVLFNKDSCRIGPPEWLQMAKTLHAARPHFDAFVLVHGTDTMAYTASALSLLLGGFRKPIVLTGSQLPLAMPRSDARQNLIDSLTCATASFSPPHVHCGEVSICFGGVLLRGNRARKTNSSAYNAFSTPTYPPLAQLGVDVGWNTAAILTDRERGVYRPRFKLNPNVIRVPIVPGCDPRLAYGDVYARGVRGVVLETFGVGNMPDLPMHGWLPWLRQQRKKGLMVYLASQCGAGTLHPELYRSGSLAMELGVQAGPQMTPECSVVKMMMCLAHPDLPLGQPIAGEL
jgi:L-asparaginase/Glu-tRNA(Gln) amidotransferase subunit D